MQLETPVCNLCGHADQHVLFPVRDHRYGGPGEFKLVECTDCSLRYISPRPIASTIHAWYPDSYTAYRKPEPSRLDRAKQLADDLWNSYLSRFLSDSYPIYYFRQRVGDFAVPGRAPRILDVGCGS